ncbi:MAG: PBP1A family penicillin-binding protein [Ignavibacteria bacterium]|nr:PBP1A family penicillin-binding protein [Ignavibacteria bacterium]
MKKRKNNKDLDKFLKDKNYRENILKKKRKQNIYTTILLYIIVILFFLFVGWLIYLSQTLPSLSELENPRLEEATKIYSDNGELIDKFYLKNRTRITIDEIPQDLINALIATEDRRFFDHWGVDLRRIVQAFIKNVISLNLTKEGASTITQQLARNLYLNTTETTLSRKLREAMTAVQIEKTYTKQEILAYYLNTVYFGKGAYGIETAAQTYFNKPAKDLNLNECAILIGLLKSPSNYDPVTNPEAAKSRRNIVLNSMYECNFISKEVYDANVEEPIKISPKVTTYTAESQYYDFTEYVRQLLQEKAEKYGFDLYRDGLKVYTTLDTRIQNHAELAIKEQLKTYQKSFNSYWNWKNHRDILNSNLDKFIKQSEEYKRCKTEQERKKVYESMKNNKAIVDSVKLLATTIQVGFVAMEVKTGYIRAMVGSNPFTRVKYGLNHAVQIKRQPGSAFKPFVYAVAINEGYSPGYGISNDPVTVTIDGKTWSPKGGGTGGIVSMREAVEKSINVVAVRTAMQIAPIDKVIKLAHDMGIKSSLPNYLSLSLGVGEVTPLEITNAYGTFANGGIWVEPVAILRIEDRNGRIIEDVSMTSTHKEVLSEGVAFIMTDVMEGVIDNGTATSIRQFFHRPCAGKTGTSQSYTDAWFIGYTPQFVAGVWLGFDDARINFGGSYGQGGRAAAPIWGRFMKYLYSDDDFDFPVEYFYMPEDVEEANICLISGLLANSSCPSSVDLVLKKQMPRRCNITHIQEIPDSTAARVSEEEN